MVAVNDMMSYDAKKRLGDRMNIHILNAEGGIKKACQSIGASEENIRKTVGDEYRIYYEEDFKTDKEKAFACLNKVFNHRIYINSVRLLYNFFFLIGMKPSDVRIPFEPCHLLA